MPFLTPNATGEAGVLSSFVRNQFAQVRSTIFGLTDAQAHERSTVSDFTVGALVDHVGQVAANYAVGIAIGAAGGDGSSPSLYRGEGDGDNVESKSVDQILADFDRRIATVTDLLDRVQAGELPLDGPVPVPDAPWFPDDLKQWEVRWVLLHLATEAARHAGHADIIRESIDGKQSYELNDLADGIEVRSWS